MKRTFSILFILIFLHCSNSNPIENIDQPEQKNIFIKNITQIANQLDETSGLVFFNNTFWTMNDSGGKAEIYAFDKKSGKITKTVSVVNAKNIDWEDVAQDKNYIYVADTGNNSGKRQEFQIYKIAKNDILSKNKEKVEVTAQKITFSFQNQPKNLTQVAAIQADFP